MIVLYIVYAIIGISIIIFLHELGHFQHGVHEAGRGRRVTVPGHARGDDGRVVRPDRPVVIRHRVVAAFARRDGPDPPA